jgi:phenylacetate-coenzyme A ligase PaaK-like adenylate-forming protein
MQSAPRLFYKFLETSINDPVREIVARLNEFMPDILTGYASGLDLMAREKLHGNLLIAPKTIGCSGDRLAPPMRRTIRDAFGVNPINLYAASESISIGAECGEHNGIHLFTDWHCCELVDDSRKPVAAGQPGTMLLTNLYNYTQPLIRYDINDVLTIDDSPCPCGLALPRVKGVDGRNEEFLWFKKQDGTDEFLHPLLLMAFYVPGLKAFQFIQTAPDTLLMKACITRNKDEVLTAVHSRMSEILAGKKLQDQVRFGVECVSHIANDAKTGKYRLVVPWRNAG